MFATAKSSTLKLNTSTVLTGIVAAFASTNDALATTIPALPTGGHIVEGVGSMSSNAQTFTVNQASQRLIADFTTFDIAGGHQVDVIQPNAGAALFRVAGSTRASQIDGKLTATGTVMIVNSQGVLINQGAEVNMGSLVVTSSDIGNKNFMAGNYTFDKAGSADAKIINKGNIKVVDGGLALLVGPNVTNDGLIEAKLGKVQLASGDTFAVDLYGDGLLNLEASPEMKEQLVKNSGKINADGGSVLLTAAAAENTLDSLINMDGVIRANSVGTKNGKVVLLAQSKGNKKATTVVSGKIEATGDKGGNVDVLGDRVALLDGADIDVSGVHGGGTVLIGGDYKGEGSVLNAQQTVLSAGAKVKANALQNGNGGKVIVWADDSTVFAGNIEAKGGALGGNGGFVETSGKEFLLATGRANASAVKGNAGTWLLDPRNVNIVNNVAGGTMSGGTYTSGTFTPNANNAQIEAGVIEGSLNGGTSVTITTGSTGTQNGDIGVSSSINKTSGGNASLTLTAAGDINFTNSADITSTSGALDVNLNAGGDVNIGNNSVITTRNGTIQVKAASFTNNEGTGAFSVGTGRWLVWTATPDNNNLGGMTAPTVKYGVASGTNAPASGNAFLYSVTPTLTVTPNATSVVYGNAAPAFTSTITGYKTNDGSIGADTTTGAAAYSTTYTQGADVGGYNISATAGTLSSARGYSFTGATLTNGLTVTQRALTMALTGTVSKVYDGTAAASLNNSNFTLGNFYSGDASNVSVASAAGTYNNKNVGTGKTVTVSSVTLAGTKSGNYSYTLPAAANIGTITQRALIVSATGVNRVYDGTNAATVTLSNNKVAGDTVNNAYTSATFADKNAVNGKTVSVSGISISGADAGNYSLSNTTATTTADITKRALIVSAVASNKTYDATNAATVTLSNNKVAGDTVNNAYTSATFANKNAELNKTVTVSGISISGADANNYTLSNTTATDLADIARRAISFTATGSDKVYDGTTAATVIVSNDKIAGDIVNNTYSTATFDTKNVGTNKIILITGINISGADAGNYLMSATTATARAAITKRNLIVSLTGVNRVYDATTNATVTLSNNKIAGDTVNNAYTSASFADKNAANGKTVTVNGISISGADAGNYNLLTTSGTTTANITKRALIVSANANDKVYDGTTAAEVTLSNDKIAGDTVNNGYTSATFSNKNAGPNKTVTVNGISISGADAGNYTLSNTTATDQANISRRAITITATGSDKVYDGTRNATVTLSDNRIAGDVLTRNYTSALFDTKNVGTDKTITVSGLSLTGADASNYTLAGTTALALADITKRNLIVSLTATNKTYDGNSNATINLSTDKISGDTVNTSYTSAGFANKNAGNNKTVTVSGISISGADAGNYNLTNTTATDLANITKRDLNITATGVDKAYTGTSDATVTLSDNRVAGDTLTTGYGNAYFYEGFFIPDADVATNKGILVTGLNISGVDASNYNIANFLNAALTSANITKRALIITATSKSMTYGANKNFAGYTSDGLQNGETIGNVALSTNATTSGSNNWNVNAVGSPWSIDAANATGGTFNINNYAVTYNSGTLTITPKALTATLTANNKVYDGTDTAGIASLTNNALTNDVVNVDNTGATFSDKNVADGKTVTLNGVALSGADSKNYSLATPVTTTANITPKALTISATGSDKVYDGNTTAVVTLGDDRVSGDVLDTDYATADYDTKNVGTNKAISVLGITLTGTDAGNYTFNTTAATDGDITKRGLLVTAKASNKVYDGTTTATVTLSDDRVMGDVLDLSYGDANFSDRNAGTAKLVTVTGIDVTGTDFGNYDFNTNTNTTANITPRDLTVTAEGKTKVYGSADPSLTFTHDALQTGDNASIFTGGLERVAGERVANGPYAINQGTLDAGQNYTINYVGDALIITPADLQVMADNKSMNFGSSLPPLTYQVSGLQFADTVGSVMSGALSTVPATSSAGLYSIDQGTVAANSDYNIIYTPGVLTILSLQDQINAALNGSNGPNVNLPRGGRTGSLLSISNGGGNPAGGFGNLAPAAGGENPGSLEPAAGGNTFSLIDCTPENPCEAI